MGIHPSLTFLRKTFSNLLVMFHTQPQTAVSHLHDGKYSSVDIISLNHVLPCTKNIACLGTEASRRSKTFPAILWYCHICLRRNWCHSSIGKQNAKTECYARMEWSSKYRYVHYNLSLRNYWSVWIPQIRRKSTRGHNHEPSTR